MSVRRTCAARIDNKFTDSCVHSSNPLRGVEGLKAVMGTV